MDDSSRAPLSIEEEMARELAALWEEFRPTIFAQLQVIEGASRAASDGTMSDASREQAKREAHKLAGSVGSFGFPEGSQVASLIEHLLNPSKPFGSPEAQQLSQLAADLRQELEKPRDGR